jgi:hypothetical protein
MPVPETHEGGHPEPSKRNYQMKADGSGKGPPTIQLKVRSESSSGTPMVT